MGISAEQHRATVGCFNNVLVSKQVPKTTLSKNNLYTSYNDKDFTTLTDRQNNFTSEQDSGHIPIYSFLAYMYFLMISLVLSMTVDLIPSHGIPYLSLEYMMLERRNSPCLSHLLSWSTVIILFLIRIPKKNVCIFYSIIEKKRKMHKFTPINFWYLMFFRDSITSFYYIASMNLILIIISTPSIVNPGPDIIKRPLNIFYNNVQGLIDISSLKSKTPRLNRTKLYELQAHIYKNKPDIVVLNETWLKKCILDSEILPENYKIFRADRSNKTHPIDLSEPKKFRAGGGGVLIAHRTDINVESTEVGLKKVQAEILTIRLKLPSGKMLGISSFYRVGTLGSENHDLVKDYLVTLASKKRLDRHVLIGDLNFPEITWPDTSTTVELHRKFINLLMTELGHTQLINKPTHKSGNILDLLFTNISDLINDVNVLGYKEACSSDHFAINFKINLDVSQKKSVKRKVYNYKKADWKSINFDLKRIDWALFVGTHNPHKSWPFLREALNKLCDKHIPKKTVNYQFQPPWFDADCEKILHDKEKWRSKANSETGTEEDQQKFCKLRKKFKKIMDEKMRLNVEDDSDPSLISKKFWKHVKSKTKSTRIPETVWYKDKFRTNLQDQANLFNEFFFAQFSDKSSYDVEININPNDRLIDLHFHELDVLLLLKDINPSKAAGPDGIHGMVLKNCAASLAKPLSIIFNISYVTGCIPEDWKLASIVPIHKKDEKGSVENYRPISLTSLTMKVFERCIKKELLDTCANKIDPRQHGFINAKSCTTQMVPFTYDLDISLNKKSKSDVIYFDFAKAFDSVSHDIILQKLKNNYEIDGLMLRFIRSYLQDRHQQVVVGGFTSSRLLVLSGVPQESLSTENLLLQPVPQCSKYECHGTKLYHHGQWKR